MILQELGIKDLERVCIKTREEVTFGKRVLEAGEPVMYFENIQIALLSEQVTPIMARGGWGNEPRVIWEDRKETIFSFTNGTLNTTSFNFLLNANMLQAKPDQPLFFVEDLYIDSDGIINLKFIPETKHKKIFFYLYDFDNLQERITPISIEGRKVMFDSKYADMVVRCDYYFYHDNEDTVVYSMARERFTNLYTLEATFLMKDENEGLYHTGLLRMPKVRVVSNINLRMGERADPAVSTFNIIALPETQGDREAVVCEVLYLDKDILGI